jgi:hypothetical protein
MSYDEEGAFGARTTFYGSRWVGFGLRSCLPRLLVTCTVHTIMMDSEQIQSESLDQVKFLSYLATHSLTLPVVIKRYAVHMLVFFFFNL